MLCIPNNKHLSVVKQQSLANAKVSAWQQCMYEGT